MDLKNKSFKSYIFTGIKETCSGCGTCVQLCKKDALSMQPDSEGFLFPVVDESKCIRCGLCDSRCPEVRNVSNKKENTQHCYVATTSDKKYYKESASIGICTMLSEYVLSLGGLVYGCYLDEDSWTAYHTKIEHIEDLDKIRNSKYLQSNTKQTYTQVKNELNDGRTILYIGTPCQIAGLKSFLNKGYENLYTIDIICHGVFSPKLMLLEANYWKRQFNCEIKNFRFRSKRIYKHVNGGMVNFDLYRNGKKCEHIERYAASSPSYFCYAYSGDGNNHNLRLACYSCKFKEKTRYADITVGDPWGIIGGKNGLQLDKQLTPKNVIRSLYSANTLKGKKLIDIVNQKLHYQELPTEQAFVQDAVCYKIRPIPTQRDILYSSLNKMEYGELVESIFQCNLPMNHKTFNKWYWTNEIKNHIKRIFFFYKYYKKWKKNKL